MDKKTIGIIASALIIGLPLAFKAFVWMHYRIYGLGIGKNKMDRQGKTPLIKAVEAGDMKLLNDLLKSRVLIDLPDSFNRTALMHAFIKGDQEMINRLLAHGANLNVTDCNNESILIWYLEARQTEMVKMLIQLGADPNIGRKQGKPPLMLAQEKGYTELVELFLEHHARIDEQDDNGHTFFYSMRMDENPKGVKSFANLMMLYNRPHYPGQSGDVEQFIWYFRNKNDAETLKRFFLQTKPNDAGTRKTVFDALNQIHGLQDDKDLIAVMQRDFQKHPLQTQLELLKASPDLFGVRLNQAVITELFHAVEKDISRDSCLKELLTALQRSGYELNRTERTCRYCNGKGEFSDYSKPLDNDCYSYPCSCFEGKQVRVSVHRNGETIAELKSSGYDAP